jgi:hypothetical protein
MTAHRIMVRAIEIQKTIRIRPVLPEGTAGEGAFLESVAHGFLYGGSPARVIPMPVAVGRLDSTEEPVTGELNEIQALTLRVLGGSTTPHTTYEGALMHTSNVSVEELREVLDTEGPLPVGFALPTASVLALKRRGLVKVLSRKAGPRQGLVTISASGARHLIRQEESED